MQLINLLQGQMKPWRRPTRIGESLVIKTFCSIAFLNSAAGRAKRGGRAWMNYALISDVLSFQQMRLFCVYIFIENDQMVTFEPLVNRPVNRRGLVHICANNDYSC
jgi:hypothetical protein